MPLLCEFACIYLLIKMFATLEIVGYLFHSEPCTLHLRLPGLPVSCWFNAQFYVCLEQRRTLIQKYFSDIMMYSWDLECVRGENRKDDEADTVTSVNMRGVLDFFCFWCCLVLHGILDRHARGIVWYGHLCKYEKSAWLLLFLVLLGTARYLG